MGRKILRLLPLTLLFALMLAPTTGATEEGVYAILYVDKTLVFQYGDAPESGRTVRETYPVNLDGGTPWSDKSSTIKTVVFKDTIQPLSMESWFSGFSSLESIQGLDKVDTSNVKHMSRLFEGCSKFEKMDLRGLDTSSVISMWGMFLNCERLTSLNLSGWDTANVVYMNRMFYGCPKLETLNISGWDTSSVKYMDYMFSGCSNLLALDVSGWDTFHVTNMYAMFAGCSSLTALDVSGWDTFLVNDMGHMFYDCSSLTALDVSGFDTSSVKYMYCMFFNCSSLTTLDLRNFETSNVTNMERIFYSCENLKTIYVSEYFEAHSGIEMFAGCISLVGGAGTKYDSNHRSGDYARIDNPPDAPGYFTYKKPAVERKPVTLTLKLRDTSGKEVVMDDLRESVEIVPEVKVEEDAPELKTADIFLVIYDSKGKMLSLQQWEVDLTNPLSFIRTTPIPQGVDASYVKFIMLSSNLTPLVAAQELA